MSVAGSQFEARVASLSRRIAEAEMRSKAADEGLAALARTGADTVEAERRFNEDLDALLLLRRQRWGLRSPEGALAAASPDRGLRAEGAASIYRWLRASLVR